MVDEVVADCTLRWIDKADPPQNFLLLSMHDADSSSALLEELCCATMLGETAGETRTSRPCASGMAVHRDPERCYRYSDPAGVAV